MDLGPKSRFFVDSNLVKLEHLADEKLDSKLFFCISEHLELCQTNPGQFTLDAHKSMLPTNPD